MSFTPPCHICNQTKTWDTAEDRWACYSDVCEGLRAGYREDQESGKSFVYFGTVPGGASPLAEKKAWERKFDKDMHAYREAKRAGEQPESVSVEGVREARQRQEALESVVAREAVVPQDG